MSITTGRYIPDLYIHQVSGYCQYRRHLKQTLGDSKSKVKKVALWHSYDSDYKKCKFKAINTSHVEMNKTAKRQTCKSHKGIKLAKRKIYSCYAKRG